LYRTKKEIAEWQTRDPITTFQSRLREQGLLADADVAGIEAAIAAELDDAVQFAEDSPWEPVEDLTRDVGAEAAKP
jgi:TPP-dependent pyruvate/acetoin dehydrogenase alpha subunit